MDEFTEACVDFHATIRKAVAQVDVYSNENVVKIINDKLMNIERAFIHNDGLPGQSYFKYSCGQWKVPVPFALNTNETLGSSAWNQYSLRWLSRAHAFRFIVEISFRNRL